MQWSSEWPRTAGWYVVHERDVRGEDVGDELLWIEPADGPGAIVPAGGTLLFLGPIPRPPVPRHRELAAMAGA